MSRSACTASLRRCLLAGAVALTATGCRSVPPPFWVFVTNERSGDLSVIDGARYTVTATIPLGKRPRGIQVSPDRGSLYVALSGSPIAGPGVDERTLAPPDRTADGIGQVDVASRRLVRVIAAGTDPEQLALTLDGRRAYVANEDAGQVSVLDLVSGKVVRSIPVGREPEGVSVRPDGGVVYVTSEDEGAVFVIDAQRDAVVAQIEVGPRPRSIAFLPDSSRAFVTLENGAAIAVVDAARHTMLGTVALGGRTVRPMGIAARADGSALYVSTGRYGHVFFVDPAASEAVGSVQVGERPWGIGLAPDGTVLFTANGPSNDVSVLDVASRRVVHRITVGDRPWGIAVLRNPAR